MLFGSDEMYMMLKELIINNNGNCDEVYKELFNSIKAYTISKLQKGFKKNEVVVNGVGRKELDTSLIPVCDYDDIVNDVSCVVLRHLDEFIINCTDKKYKEAQRQSWLRMHIYHVCVDYFKAKSKFPLSSNGNIPTLSRDIKMAEFHELLTLVIHSVCTYKSNMVEKKMAYIFNAIIFKEFNERKENASAKTTLKFMNGKTMFLLKNKMCLFIYEFFSLKLKDKDIDEIVKIVGSKTPTEEGNRTCEITAKKITDWTNRIKMHVISELYKAGVAYNG